MLRSVSFSIPSHDTNVWAPNMANTECDCHLCPEQFVPEEGAYSPRLYLDVNELFLLFSHIFPLLFNYLVIPCLYFLLFYNLAKMLKVFYQLLGLACVEKILCPTICFGNSLSVNFLFLSSFGHYRNLRR